MSTPVPRIVRWLLRLAAPPDHRDALLLDLDEEADGARGGRRLAAARRWSRRQIRRRLDRCCPQRRDCSSTPEENLHGRGVVFEPICAVAGRRLREAPGFTLVCVLTLALGIGGNTAVFTLIDRVMLKPLPVHGRRTPSDRRHRRVLRERREGSFSLFSYDLYLRLRDVAPEFNQLAAFQANTRSITIGRADADTPPQTFTGVFVSGNYFQMLELVPAAGRLIQPTDDARGAAPAAVISYRAWRERFQGRADVIGASTTLNGVAAVIVGVAPPGFYGEMMRVPAPEIWVPLASEPMIAAGEPAARGKNSPLAVRARTAEAGDPARAAEGEADQ